MYVILGILGKVGAVFIIMPYPVLGGITIMSFGMFIGVTLSYLSYADISSTRNLTIVGISILLGLMLPYWMAQNLDKIQTGELWQINHRISIYPVLFVVYLEHVSSA